jgi:hypothetical protein
VRQRSPRFRHSATRWIKLDLTIVADVAGMKLMLGAPTQQNVRVLGDNIDTAIAHWGLAAAGSIIVRNGVDITEAKIR